MIHSSVHARKASYHRQQPSLSHHPNSQYMPSQLNADPLLNGKIVMPMAVGSHISIGRSSGREVMKLDFELDVMEGPQVMFEYCLSDESDASLSSPTLADIIEGRCAIPVCFVSPVQSEQRLAGEDMDAIDTETPAIAVTTVNGQELKARQELAHGDRLVLGAGSAVFVFVECPAVLKRKRMQAWVDSGRPPFHPPKDEVQEMSPWAIADAEAREEVAMKEAEARAMSSDSAVIDNASFADSLLEVVHFARHQHRTPSTTSVGEVADGGNSISPRTDGVLSAEVLQSLLKTYESVRSANYISGEFQLGMTFKLRVGFPSITARFQMGYEDVESYLADAMRTDRLRIMVEGWAILPLSTKDDDEDNEDSVDDDKSGNLDILGSLITSHGLFGHGPNLRTLQTDMTTADKDELIEVPDERPFGDQLVELRAERKAAMDEENFALGTEIMVEITALEAMLKRGQTTHTIPAYPDFEAAEDGPKSDQDGDSENIGSALLFCCSSEDFQELSAALHSIRVTAKKAIRKLHARKVLEKQKEALQNEEQHQEIKSPCNDPEDDEEPRRMFSKAKQMSSANVHSFYDSGGTEAGQTEVPLHPQVNVPRRVFDALLALDLPPPDMAKGRRKPKKRPPRRWLSVRQVALFLKILEILPRRHLEIIEGENENNHHAEDMVLAAAVAFIRHWTRVGKDDGDQLRPHLGLSYRSFMDALRAFYLHGSIGSTVEDLCRGGSGRNNFFDDSPPPRIIFAALIFNRSLQWAKDQPQHEERAKARAANRAALTADKLKSALSRIEELQTLLAESNESVERLLEHATSPTSDCPQNSEEKDDSGEEPQGSAPVVSESAPLYYAKVEDADEYLPSGKPTPKPKLLPSQRAAAQTESTEPEANVVLIKNMYSSFVAIEPREERVSNPGIRAVKPTLLTPDEVMRKMAIARANAEKEIEEKKASKAAAKKAKLKAKLKQKEVEAAEPSGEEGSIMQDWSDEEAELAREDAAMRKAKKEAEAKAIRDAEAKEVEEEANARAVAHANRLQAIEDGNYGYDASSAEASASSAAAEAAKEMLTQATAEAAAAAARAATLEVRLRSTQTEAALASSEAAKSIALLEERYSESSKHLQAQLERKHEMLKGAEHVRLKTLDQMTRLLRLMKAREKEVTTIKRESDEQKKRAEAAVAAAAAAAAEEAAAAAKQASFNSFDVSHLARISADFTSVINRKKETTPPTMADVPTNVPPPVDLEGAEAALSADLADLPQTQEFSAFALKNQGKYIRTKILLLCPSSCDVPSIFF
jgi:hypothetical protein